MATTKKPTRSTAKRSTTAAVPTLRFTPEQIVPGASYANAAGDVRRVLSDADIRGPAAQARDRDTLQYVVERGRGAGREFSMTRKAFARWAAAQVAVPEVATDGARLDWLERTSWFSLDKNAGAYCRLRCGETEVEGVPGVRAAIDAAMAAGAQEQAADAAAEAR